MTKHNKSDSAPTETTAQRTSAPTKQDHLAAIRSHIAELVKTGDQDLKNKLGKIVVRLDRIEGKSA